VSIPKAHFLAQNGIGLPGDPTAERSTMTDDEREQRLHRVFIDVPPAELAGWWEAAERAAMPLESFVKRAVFRCLRRDKIAGRFGLNARRGWWRL
jgi:hypothetical protein